MNSRSGQVCCPAFKNRFSARCHRRCRRLVRARTCPARFVGPSGAPMLQRFSHFFCRAPGHDRRHRSPGKCPNSVAYPVALLFHLINKITTFFFRFNWNPQPEAGHLQFSVVVMNPEGAAGYPGRLVGLFDFSIHLLHTLKQALLPMRSFDAGTIALPEFTHTIKPT